MSPEAPIVATSPVVLVAAVPGDVWVFWELRTEEQPGLDYAAHEQWWHGVVEHRFVAMVGNRVVGTIRLSQDGVISTIVAKAARGRGIATAMQTEILPIARALGFTRLSAVTAEDNVASQRALLRAGWTPVGFTVAL